MNQFWQIRLPYSSCYLHISDHNIGKYSTKQRKFFWSKGGWKNRRKKCAGDSRLWHPPSPTRCARISWLRRHGTWPSQSRDASPPVETFAGRLSHLAVNQSINVKDKSLTNGVLNLNCYWQLLSYIHILPPNILSWTNISGCRCLEDEHLKAAVVLNP